MSTSEERAKYGNTYCGGPMSYRFPKDMKEFRALLQASYDIGVHDGRLKTKAAHIEDKKALEPQVLAALVDISKTNAQLAHSVSQALLSVSG